jgi:site-specific DNA-methyltransferase (adenine-specific)
MSIYYQDDYVTLYHGDCLTDHREWLGADVLVTDPPYGMAYRDRKGRHEEIAGDADTAARSAMIEAWGSKPSLVFGTWRVERPLPMKNLLIWDKGPDVGMGVSNPWGLSHEEVYVLGDWPKPKPGGWARLGGTPSRVPSVIRVDKYNNMATERPDHPTPKPVSLMEKLVERCPPGAIADPFAGSGATLMAAKNLNRKVIGVELEEKYCEIIAKRCSQEVFDFGLSA